MLPPAGRFLIAYISALFPINRIPEPSVIPYFSFVISVSDSLQVEMQAPVQTFASPTFSSFLDMLLCCSVLLALSFACFLQPLVTQQPLPISALIVAAVTGMIECLALVLAVQ